MNRTFGTIFRWTRTLGMLAILVALLCTSSSHSFLEECPQEVVSQEAEAGLIRRDEASTEKIQTIRLVSGGPVFKCCGLTGTGYGSVARRVAERDKLNGLGTHLLI